MIRRKEFFSDSQSARDDTRLIEFVQVTLADAQAVQCRGNFQIFAPKGTFLYGQCERCERFATLVLFLIKIKQCYVAHGQSGFGTVSPKVLLADTKDSLKEVQPPQ